MMQELYRSRRFDFLCSLRDLLTDSLNHFFRAVATDVVDADFLPAIGLRRGQRG